MPDCVFCKIRDGQIPAMKVFEDARTICIMDINPLNPGHCLVLAKAHAALPAGGALLVYETILDDERRENAFGLLMSLNMLIETPAGGDYTRAECATWLHEAGCRETYAEHLLGPDSMVVGIK